MKAQAAAQQSRQAPGAPSEAPQALESNQQAAEQVGSAGLGNYTDTLGSWLGPMLYEAVSDALTEEAFAGYTEQVIEALFSELSRQGQALPGGASAEQFDGLAASLRERLGPIAESWIAERGEGLRQSLRDWVDAHPILIVTTGLLAAAGAVIADLDIPTLEQEFGIAEGLTGSVGADLGSLRNIAIEQLKASLEYASGPLVAAVNVNHASDGTSGGASVRYTDGPWAAGLAGTLDRSGDLSGSADASYTDGPWAAGLRGAVDADGNLSGSADASYTGERWGAGLEGAVDADGNLSGSSNLSYTDGPWAAGLRGARSGGGDLSGSADLSYTDGPWAGTLQAAMDGAGSLGGSTGLSYTREGRSLSAGASLQDGSLSSLNLSGSTTRDGFTNTMSLGLSDEVWSAEASQRYEGERWSGGLSRSLDSTGALSTSGDLGYTHDDLSLLARAGLSDDQLSYDLSSSLGPEDRRLGLGLSGTGSDWRATGSAQYSKDQVRAELEAWLQSDGGVGGDLEVEFSSGDWQAGGDASFELGDDRLLDVGLYAGFRSRESFRTWMGRYSYESLHDNHKFGLLAEEKLGSIYARLEQNTVVGATGTQFDTRLHGAYFLDEGEDLGIIAGVRHLRDFDGSQSFTPELGMQFEKHALTVGYNTDTQGVSVNFVLPFGR